MEDPVIRLEEGLPEREIIDRIAEIEAQAYSVPWDAESIADTLRFDHNFIILATVRDRVAGYLIFNLIMEQSELLKITVDKDFRRTGIARKLIDRYTEELRGTADTSLLEVRESNVPATALYESCGYKKIATRKVYYSEPSEDAIVMSLEL